MRIFGRLEGPDGEGAPRAGGRGDFCLDTATSRGCHQRDMDALMSDRLGHNTKAKFRRRVRSSSEREHVDFIEAFASIASGFEVRFSASNACELHVECHVDVDQALLQFLLHDNGRTHLPQG